MRRVISPRKTTRKAYDGHRLLLILRFRHVAFDCFLWSNLLEVSKNLARRKDFEVEGLLFAFSYNRPSESFTL